MRRFSIISILFLLPCLLSAKAPRKVHYTPWHDIGTRCIDGTAKFNRGLYGAHSGFRVDCSDTPEFGIYLPRMGGNMLFTLPNGKCKSYYIPGRMNYFQGGVALYTNVLRSEDAAIWRICNKNDYEVSVPVRFGGVADKKFSREGDLGVDPPDCFELKPEYCEDNVFTVSGDTVKVGFGKKERRQLSLIIPSDDGSVIIDEMPCYHGTIGLAPGETKYMALFPPSSQHLVDEDLAQLFDKAEAEIESITNTLRIFTPNDFLNPVGGALAVAADGIWSGEAWLHGAIGWRTPHLGWRGAYTGDALGLHDRAYTHFANYARNQITDIPAIYPHPAQDSTQNLARAAKKWGTPMYSNGYICRRPGHKDEMSHYDMNIVYIDALLRHFRHTGDSARMREFFPVIQRHLDWEKRNFDPDGDGLYDAYCCIWASDALYYTGGDVTHSSAYNYFANRMTGEIADAIGVDSQPYYDEAEKIKNAIDYNLWMPELGHWAEYRDRDGHRRLHPLAALWTIYHSIDSEITDPFKAYAATTYIDREIPHIPISVDYGDHVSDEEFYLLSTTSWKPYSWSINNVAIAEMMHTALAYWQAGRDKEAYDLMCAVIEDNMYLGASPLNFGQISYYDAARDECYRDFADPIGVWSRALVEGLFGIKPNLVGISKYVEVRPGFPSEWPYAGIKLPDIEYIYGRDDDINSDKYEIHNRYGSDANIILNARVDAVPVSVKVNDKDVAIRCDENSIGTPRIIIDAGSNDSILVEISYGETIVPKPTGEFRYEGPICFAEVSDGPLTWWLATTDQYKLKDKSIPDDGFDDVDPAKLVPVDISKHFNSNVSDIFNNEYLSPRPDVTTLQIPKQGIGDWCHPKTMADIDDSGLRNLLSQSGNKLALPNGIEFTLPSEGKNIVYTSLWDNYPDKVTIDASGNASHAYLVMAGSTNHMEYDMVNGLVRFNYTDGTSDAFDLINPYTWAPIEQDFYNDDYAFSLPEGRQSPMRLHLASGKTSRNLGDELGITGVDGRRIEGGAAIVLDAKLNPKKKLRNIEIETISGNVVVGLMAITLQRP